MEDTSQHEDEQLISSQTTASILATNVLDSQYFVQRRDVPEGHIDGHGVEAERSNSEKLVTYH